MLIARGHDVSFVMADGRDIEVSGALLHDSSGKAWPKCSALIATFKRGPAVEMDAESKDYFGRGYDAHEGRVELPPRDLKAWKLVGEVKKIFYERTGRHHGLFQHEMGKRRLWAFFKSGKATLYRLGRAYRLELGKGCIWDSRGLVFP